LRPVLFGDVSQKEPVPMGQKGEKMLQITSKENQLIKHIIKLKEKKYRKEYNEYIIEGVKIVEEAIEEKAKIKQIIISEDAINSELVQKHLKEKLQKIDYIQVPSNIFKLISEVEKPQGVLAVIKKENGGEDIDYNQDIILALDDLQDPGNLGTIIRTADSVGLNQILISKGTTDSYNSKVIRSTMGAIFRVKIVECEDLKQTLKRLQENNFKVMVTDLGTDKSIYDIKLQKNVIVIGNEANGVSKEIKKIADTKAIIPMFGKTESLNASIATGVILYEYVRQKLQEK
jgi:TrmH family RNA methyltransferase